MLSVGMGGVPTPFARVDLGVVSFEATPSWRFFPMEDRIVGRPTNGVGVVQIVRLPDDAVSPPASHERCMAVAKETSGYQATGPGNYRARDYEENCLAGGESFTVGDDFVRVWYRHCPAGMVAAWYACPANRSKERSVVQAVRECDRMIATVALPPPVA
jgi:hypothetical protein